MSPLGTTAQGTEDVHLGVKVFVPQPLPGDLAGRGNLPEGISPHHPFMLGPGDAPLDPGSDVVRYGNPPEGHSIAIVHTAEVVVEIRVLILPYNIAVPVYLEQHATGTTDVTQWSVQVFSRIEQIPAG